MVASAVLELYVTYMTGGSMTGDYSVFQIVQPWVENEATWENLSKDRQWTNPGGDVLSTAITKVTWPRANGNTWIKFNILNLIKKFVKTPETNHGLLVRNTSGAQEIEVASSENEESELRPRLTITYEEGTSVIMRTNPAMSRSFTIGTLQRGISFKISSNAPAAWIMVFRPDGTPVFSGSVASGEYRTLSPRGAGVYVLSVRQAGRTQRLTASVMP